VKGKPVERWGRKASGLTEEILKAAGLPMNRNTDRGLDHDPHADDIIAATFVMERVASLS
jgi:hypothetical protein